MLSPVMPFRFTNVKQPIFQNSPTTEIVSFLRNDDYELQSWIEQSVEKDFDDYGIYDDTDWDFSDKRPYLSSYYNLPSIKICPGYTIAQKPDKSQIDCAKALCEDKTVLYVAPTGTGKTAVASFAINKNLEEHKKTIIPVPIVALANDKYKEFRAIYGDNNVGILTGERKINPNAPITIMTAEIFHNQLNELKENASKIGTIVFDEAHYIGHPERGNIWENAIIEASKNNVQMLFLSATVGNKENLACWLSSLTPQSVSLVNLDSSQRYVPLTWSIYKPNCEDVQDKFSSVVKKGVNLNSLEMRNGAPVEVEDFTDRQKHALRLIYLNFMKKPEHSNVSDTQYFLIRHDLLNKIEQRKFDTTEEFSSALKNAYGFNDDLCQEISLLLADEKSRQVQHIFQQHENKSDYTLFSEDLKKNNMLPALIFKLSRNDADIVAQSIESDFTTDDEKVKIKEIIDKYNASDYLGNDLDENMLLRGIASHHAAKLPAYRKLVEELFSKNLLKVVCATSTLSVGINMPAKTVVVTDMTYRRYDLETKSVIDIPISVNEFHQMVGRAGRRGIDKIGNIVLYNLKSKPKDSKQENERIDELELAYQYINAKSDNLRSSFKPDPCILTNYYSQNSNDKGLMEYVSNSFKVYSAKPNDKQKTFGSVFKRFKNFSDILLKQGFLWHDNQKNTYLTPKGEMLSHAQGANPMLLTSLVYDGNFKNLSTEQIVQMASYIANSDSSLGISKADTLGIIKSKMGEISSSSEDFEILFSDFICANEIYSKKYDKYIKSLKEAKIPSSDIPSFDSVQGYIAYMWCYLNSINPNSIENFETISLLDEKELENTGSEQDKMKNQAIKNYNRQISQGLCYKSLVHTISVLRQIERVCEFALKNPDNYPEVEYYSNLLNNAKYAINLMNVAPLNTEEVE